MSRAFVFPGQASQTVGMGREVAGAFAVAKEIFEEVDEALKQNLSKLMFEGPGDELVLTENAQPAIMAVSLAVMRVLAEEGGIDLSQAAAFVAGHSLGEYSALAAVGCLSVADTAALLKTRGRAMQEAVPLGEGAMAALIGLDLETVGAVAEEAAGADVCTTANDNAPGQVVVSGTAAAVERAVEIAKDKGAKRAIMLPVSAPFHCPLMAPAADVMADALADISITPLPVALVANITAQPVTDPAEIRHLLVEQVTGMVRWRECVLTMKEQGVDTMVEIGAGKVLSGLGRRIDADLDGMSVGTPETIEEFLNGL
ncbi:MAG: [acyl-carrier-protein] S-malonyltransferase [Rhodospirillaceae bacterium]|jgi:[acyl-carrier-protein] S-malonyltransferase|nr:[acyl-carrier-protein] S-malonyltransferase [Rhodospirillaceae bacterium]|tara:strand:- start:151 stop:1092 length:942 start_codon:yes stop_codon:yes gene_type:complete